MASERSEYTGELAMDSRRRTSLFVDLWGLWVQGGEST